MSTRILIIIPAYNEAEVIAKTLSNLRHFCDNSGYRGIDFVVIDDGSSDQTGTIARDYADFVLTHRRNCGLGASLATGLAFAKRQAYDYCITFDSDGQHDPQDIKKALKSLESGNDVVIGSRFLGTVSGLPSLRRAILRLGNLVTWLFFGVWTSDSQSGFRGLSKSAIQLLDLKSNRMEVSSEFFGEIKRLGLKFAEIPIHIRYTAYSLRKGQKNLNSAKVLVKLLYMRTR